MVKGEVGLPTADIATRDARDHVERHMVLTLGTGSAGTTVTDRPAGGSR